MTKEHLERLEALAAPLQDALPPGVYLDCLHFFSGAAAYVNSNIFMTLTPVGLAMKLPEEARQELVEAGGKALRHFPVGPIKKEYVVVPGAIADDPDRLHVWAMQAIDYALEDE
jgi:TfoX/Sxy family transcriptional regulator of competence genes